MGLRGKSVFARRLGQIMQFEDLSQAEVARLLEVSRATVNAWCTGSAEPLVGRIDHVADRLGVRKAFLIGDDEPCALSAEFMMLHRRVLSLDGVDRKATQAKLDEFTDYLRYLRSRTKKPRNATQ